MDGRRDVSLYAGMMTLRSMEPTSARDGRLRGSLRDFDERYVFSEGWVIIGGGESKMRAR
jgi:hypothetical protein